MAGRYPSVGYQPAIHEPDLPAELHILRVLPYWCVVNYVNHTKRRKRWADTLVYETTEAPEVVFIKIAPAATDPHQPSSQPSSQQTTPFAGRPIPIHPHIYSNGIICLDLLGTAGWSPVQSVESVCMSIQSMLTGNSKNERPQGDEQFCQSMGVRGPDGWTGYGRGRGGRGLRDVRFAYDDDTV